MNFVKSLTVILTVAVLGFLAACSDTNTVTVDKANQMATAAAKKAADETAAKKDAALVAATKEMEAIGRGTARQGGYSAEANCNVMPQSVAESKAAKDFPSSAAGMFRDACKKEVAVMNGERKAMKDQAVARAKANEAKLAAKRAKAAEIAQKTAKHRHASSVQQVRPSAVKPVAKTDRRS